MQQPATLQEALNTIKFLKTAHQNEISKWKESYKKQTENMRKLEATRKKELDFLSTELRKYEVNLATRTESVAIQIAEKDEIILKQAEIIEELTLKLDTIKTELDCAVRKERHSVSVPEITILSVDSNSDSGIMMESEDSPKQSDQKTEVKTRRCRRLAESISFLRRVDFSPMKYKPSNRDNNKTNKKEEGRKCSLDLPVEEPKRVLMRQDCLHSASESDRLLRADNGNSDSTEEPLAIKPKIMSESMNNHFSDDGSESTSEEVFNRVMTRSSVRRSVKANPKYKKINRTKSKLLEQVKLNIVN